MATEDDPSTPARRPGRRGGMGRRANREGTVDAFRNGYRGRIEIEGTRRTVYGKTSAEVVRKMRDLRRAAEDGVALETNVDQLTVLEAVEMWRQANRIRCRPPTLRYYDQRLSHILPIIGHMRLRKVTADHLNRFHERKLAAGMSGNGVAKLRTVESIFFNWCKKKHWIATNPALESERPRTRKYRATRLSADETIRLLQVVREHRLGALVYTALTTGMREGELLGLLWSDVDFDRTLIHVRHSLYREYDPMVKTRGPVLFAIGDVKTEGSERSIPLVDIAVDALQAHRGRQAGERLKAGQLWHDSDLVFCTELGTPLASWNVAKRFFQPALQQAGCPPIRLYDLRHSSATLLRALDVPIEVISAILGHAGLEITLSTYVEILDETKRAALKKLGDRLREGGV